MGWTEKDLQTGAIQVNDSERAGMLDQLAKESRPSLIKEVMNGEPRINPLDFQPVKSPNNFEAEFAKKDDDLIFHFWPFSYHQVERAAAEQGVENPILPSFKKSFEGRLRQAMTETFVPVRVEIFEDVDMGAWFVRARNYGTDGVFRKLAIKAVTRLHELMEQS